MGSSPPLRALRSESRGLRSRSTVCLISSIFASTSPPKILLRTLAASFQEFVADNYLTQPNTFSEGTLPEETTFSDVEENAMAQVTSVSQLSDVQPSDWAFQALQSLVERYGVIAGYPDGTIPG